MHFEFPVTQVVCSDTKFRPNCQRVDSIVVKKDGVSETGLGGGAGFSISAADKAACAYFTQKFQGFVGPEGC